MASVCVLGSTYIGLFQKKYTPPPPTDGKLGISCGRGGGFMALEIRAGGGDLNLKILPWESHLT